MKKIKLALLFAIGTFGLQACGNNTSDETTQTDTTMMTVPEPDKTEYGLSDADQTKKRYDSQGNEIRESDFRAGSNAAIWRDSRDNRAANQQEEPGMMDDTGHYKRSMDYPDNKREARQLRGNPNERDLEYLKERHLNRDTTNPRAGVGNSR